MNINKSCSGLDRPISGTLPQTTNSQSRVKESLDITSWSNFNLYLNTGCYFPSGKKATLVSCIYRYTTLLGLWNDRFIPPHLDRETPNIENSENTSLFLVSCFEYIFSGLVLSVGPPFRQTISQNRKSR